MKIKVRAEKARFTLPIPNWALRAALTRKLALRAINDAMAKGGLPPLAPRDMRRLCDALREARACLGGLPLVDVRSASGERVEIRL